MAAATVVVALAAVLLGRAGVFTPNPSAGSSGASTSWQTYHDPSGLFTLRVPPGWTTHIDLSTATYGDSGGSVSVSEEKASLDDPAQGTVSAYFRIDADSINTASARHVFCQQPSTLQRFSPRNLSIMEQTGAIWFFTTANASFQIDVAIPGILEPATFGHPLPTVAPIPAAWLAADKMEVNEMLISFQPTNPTPLAC